MRSHAAPQMHLHLAVMIFFMMAAPWCFAQPIEPERELPARFHLDLRKGQPDDLRMRATGEVIIWEPEGGRVTLAAGKRPQMTAGLSTRFKVQGDFDVVCSFELLHVEKPDKGFGSGATLYAAVNPNAGIAVSMARRVMPDGKNVILAVHQQNINDAKKTTSKSAPAASSTGKMRLQRTGAKVRFLYADGDALEFKELSVVDFSADDIAYVQIGAHNWGGESAVDVRFLDFDLRAERLPGLPNDGLPEPAAAVAQPLEPPTENSIWLIVTGGIVLGIGLIGGAALLAFLFWRRRSQPSQAALTSSGNEKAKITFDCLACGKTIRIKAEQRDKKFKCPHCGEVAARPRKIVDLT